MVYRQRAAVLGGMRLRCMPCLTLRRPHAWGVELLAPTVEVEPLDAHAQQVGVLGAARDPHALTADR